MTFVVIGTQRVNQFHAHFMISFFLPEIISIHLKGFDHCTFGLEIRKPHVTSTAGYVNFWTVGKKGNPLKAQSTP